MAGPRQSGIDTFLENGARYAGGFSKGSLPAPPASGVAILTCMDARLTVAALLGLEEGDAHVIRNAGGVVSDDALRSLMISQRLLGTREIMVVQHTGCGMMTFTDEELASAVEKDTGQRPPFAIHAFADLEESVRDSVARLEASPFLQHKDAVRGFVYEVETGRLREVSG